MIFRWLILVKSEEWHLQVGKFPRYPLQAWMWHWRHTPVMVQCHTWAPTQRTARRCLPGMALCVCDPLGSSHPQPLDPSALALQRSSPRDWHSISPLMVLLSSRRCTMNNTHIYWGSTSTSRIPMDYLGLEKRWWPWRPWIKRSRTHCEDKSRMFAQFRFGCLNPRYHVSVYHENNRGKKMSKSWSYLYVTGQVSSPMPGQSTRYFVSVSGTPPTNL